MRKSILFSVFLMLILSQWCFADQQAIDLFVQGNVNYEEESYANAIAEYQELLSSGKENGALFYNLGNAYFKQGDLGRAILNYQRAMQYIPRDTDLRANYRYAESLVQKMEGQSSGNIIQQVLQQHFRIYTINEMTWILVFLLMLLSAMHLASLYFSWRITRKAAVLGILMVLMAFFCYGIHLKVQYLQDRAVVLTDAAARFEPREDATVHFSLFEGNSVKKLKDGGAWAKVQRFDGKTGWIKSGMIEQIQM